MRIPIFPVEGIPEPWAWAFDVLTNRPFLQFKTDFQSHLARGALTNKCSLQKWDALDALEICHRVLFLHRVVKSRFLPTHQIPIGMPIQEKGNPAYEPLGVLYVSVLNLCEIVTQSEIEAAQCFFVLVFEAAIEYPHIPLNKKNRAQKCKSTLKEENKKLESGVNPFIENEDPGTHHLINAAKSMATQNQNAADLWDEFLAARKKWVTILNGPGFRTLTASDNGQLRLHLAGRGRGTSPVKFELSDSRREAGAKYASNELIQPSVPLGMGSLPSVPHILLRPIVAACLMLLSQENPWQGTSSEFLNQINQIKGNQNWGDDWPTTPESLGKKWKGLIPKLKQVGIEVTQARHGKSRARIVRLWRRTG
jgi:hypothetical protein